jgi:hypothetical protein
MTADVATTTADTRRLPRAVPWLAGGLILAGMLWLAYPSDSGVFLDPRSTGASGTAGILAALEDVGVEVTITGEIPDDHATVVVVFSDHLTDGQRVDLAHWVEAGGRLVLLDPRSPLNPVTDLELLITDTFGAIDVEPGCDLLDGYVSEVRSIGWLIMPASPTTSDACFVIGDGYGLVTEAVGDGQITVTGVSDALVNTNIRDQDHARLAAALFAPAASDGGASLAVLWDDPDGPRTLGGDVALLDLAPTGARAAGGLLIAAAVVYAWSRARRHGGVVVEEAAVRVPGSELALAIGDLLQRHDHVNEAARRLRDDARAEVAHALSMPGDTPADVLVEILAAHYPDLEGLSVTLLDRPLRRGEDLQRLAGSIARLRRRLRGGPSEPPR